MSLAAVSRVWPRFASAFFRCAAGIDALVKWTEAKYNHHVSAIQINVHFDASAFHAQVRARPLHLHLAAAPLLTTENVLRSIATFTGWSSVIWRGVIAHAAFSQISLPHACLLVRTAAAWSRLRQTISRN